ncbi:helix-turn-helix domain-containing protein [Vibrio sp. S11_S32]|uniref:GlxA family transcriptional regulator n=1 Tax=Vibrio sp. S11_S32 TaxID=2720225 RepID=UPI00168185EC|nr:helix-turn-helix domain-containing protein [Vibrio sp. S11_S32]MBD1577419.1 helix-turn-helix domain-containing protein [Vibrio sp. S11_S32]
MILPSVNIGVFTPQGCSPLSEGLLREPFILANQLLEQDKYQLTLLDHSVLTTLQEFDLLIVLAEQAPQQPISFSVKHTLQYYYQHNTPILSVHAGLYWIFDSGIEANGKFTNKQPDHDQPPISAQTLVAHWSLLDDLKEKYPNAALTDQLFQFGPHLSSCAGQTALLDCVLHYLQPFEEDELIQQLTELLCMKGLRNGEEKQRTPLMTSTIDAKLSAAIALMESHIETPLTTDDIANQVYISRRQLERLFKRHLDSMPARHYMQVRLKHAKHLLQTTSTSIVQIGLKCGFSSGPHFSSAYKTYYQLTPREERSKLNISS